MKLRKALWRSAGVSKPAIMASLAVAHYIFPGPLRTASNIARARPLRSARKAINLPRSDRIPASFATSSNSSRNVHASPSSKASSHGTYNHILATAPVIIIPEGGAGRG
ncbi:unnamed protein product [Echinostoma caproni]|uniref:Secreted protein n=1 Tax=Echinostoma caproni TaxID=27848 RepID=A0A183AE54_9TREM|nr:unnamed protein product [Echinostoma caproni]